MITVSVALRLPMNCPRVEDRVDRALLPRLERLFGDVRLGAAATAAHADDVDVFFKNVLELEVEFGFRTLGDRAEIMLGGLEHLARPRLGTRHRSHGRHQQPTNEQRAVHR